MEKKRKEEEVLGGEASFYTPEAAVGAGRSIGFCGAVLPVPGHVPGHVSEVSTVRWSVIIRRCFQIETTSQFALTIDHYSIRISQLTLVTRHMDLMKTGIIYGSKIIHHRHS